MNRLDSKFTRGPRSLVRELPDGAFQIVDGHLRAETTPDSIVPVLVVDLDDEEAE